MVDSAAERTLQVAATVGAVIMTFLAMLSKEMGATLPMLCSFWDFFVVAKLRLV